MPDLSHLREAYLFPALAIRLAGGMGPKISEKASLYLRNFIRLIDKSIDEYLEIRKYILLQIEEKNRPIEEMEKGRISYHIGIVNHAENCINAIRRLYHSFEALKNDPSASKLLPRNSRKLLESYENNVREVRNVVEHLDEDIQKDKHNQGQPVMLCLTNDHKGLYINQDTIGFYDLALVIKKFYEIGKILLSEGSDKAPKKKV